MCILRFVLKTPLATLRRASNCPRLLDLAKELGVRVQRLNSVESGRIEVSDDFLADLARALGFRKEHVIAAYLQGRRARLRFEARAIEERLATLAVPRRRSA